MKVMIENVKQLQIDLFSDYKLMFCLGEMRELGEYCSQAHRELAELLFEYKDIFVVGESMKKNFLPFHETAIHFPNSRLL